MSQNDLSRFAVARLEEARRQEEEASSAEASLPPMRSNNGDPSGARGGGRVKPPPLPSTRTHVVALLRETVVDGVADCPVSSALRSVFGVA